MNWHNTLAGASLAVMAASTSALAQSPHIIAPPDQIVAVKAGHLFDSKSGEMLSNQVVLIKGDRVTDVGPNVQIPAGAKVIDLSGVTVMPGMIDTHVHVNTGGATAAQRTLIALANAQTDLHAGFTTVMDMD
jgi:imidazolonepropionase-like amidohydrolase